MKPRRRWVIVAAVAVLAIAMPFVVVYLTVGSRSTKVKSPRDWEVDIRRDLFVYDARTRMRARKWIMDNPTMVNIAILTAALDHRNDPLEAMLMDGGTLRKMGEPARCMVYATLNDHSSQRIEAGRTQGWEWLEPLDDAIAMRLCALPDTDPLLVRLAEIGVARDNVMRLAYDATISPDVRKAAVEAVVKVTGESFPDLELRLFPQELRGELVKSILRDFAREHQRMPNDWTELVEAGHGVLKDNGRTFHVSRESRKELQDIPTGQYLLAFGQRMEDLKLVNGEYLTDRSGEECFLMMRNDSGTRFEARRFSLLIYKAMVRGKKGKTSAAALRKTHTSPATRKAGTSQPRGKQ